MPQATKKLETSNNNNEVESKDVPPQKVAPKPKLTESNNSNNEDVDLPPSRAPPQPPKKPLTLHSTDDIDQPDPELISIKVSYRQSTVIQSNNNDGENLRSRAFSNVDLPNLEGNLEKRGDKGMIKAWKSRYFQLKKDRLIYFADQVLFIFRLLLNYFLACKRIGFTNWIYSINDCNFNKTFFWKTWKFCNNNNRT
jgi:hypothetical protein